MTWDDDDRGGYASTAMRATKGPDGSGPETADRDAEPLDARFTRFLLETGALRFGDFTLKSGRRSPYFINAGAFDDGYLISRLGGFYAERILAAVRSRVLPSSIDTVFGPAYKGIPLAVATTIALGGRMGSPLGYTFDRKERKDHGDGGMFVGRPLHDGMRVLLVDDVMTAGTAVREVIPKLRAAADVRVVGLVLSVDRMERSGDGGLSAVESVRREFGFPVISIANVREILAAARDMHDAQDRPVLDDALWRRAQDYMAEYGAAED